MKSKTKRENEIKRLRIKEYIKAGYIPSQIAKETGYTYNYVKMIFDQEKESNND